MKETENLCLHPTNSGGDTGPMIWKFSGKDVFTLGASLMGGLMTFIRLGALNLPFAITVFGAATIPLVTLGILLALADKPDGFVRHWLDWQWIKRRGHGLFEFKPSKEQNDGF